jgi:hypothetical protein
MPQELPARNAARISHPRRFSCRHDARERYVERHDPSLVGKDGGSGQNRRSNPSAASTAHTRAENICGRATQTAQGPTEQRGSEFSALKEGVGVQAVQQMGVGRIGIAFEEEDLPCPGIVRCQRQVRHRGIPAC